MIMLSDASGHTLTHQNLGERVLLIISFPPFHQVSRARAQWQPGRSTRRAGLHPGGGLGLTILSTHTDILGSHPLKWP